MVNRKSFLQMAGGATAGMLAATTLGTVLGGCSKPSDDPASEMPTPREPYPFGLQLYSLRDVIQDDPKATLRQVADFGYRQIESYAGPQGIFWGMTNTEFKTFLDDIGLKMVASHVGIGDGFERTVEEAAAIGVPYLICPYIGKQETMDGYKTYAETFNRCGEICRQADMAFAYHNHAYSFQAVDGVYPQDVLMEHCDPSLVDFELDMYWVVAAGEDPARWLLKYPDRFVFGHVKDRLKTAPPEEMAASTTLGQGSIDYAALLPVAREHGMRHFIVEQEQYEGTTPMDGARDGAGYMKEVDWEG